MKCTVFTVREQTSTSKLRIHGRCEIMMRRTPYNFHVSAIGFSVFSIVSHADTLQNLATKDLATRQFDNSGSTVACWRSHYVFTEEVNLIVTQQSDRPRVSGLDPLRKNNAPAFETLWYEAVEHTKDKYKKTVMMADRNVLRSLITAYEAVGWPVKLLAAVN